MRRQVCRSVGEDGAQLYSGFELDHKDKRKEYTWPLPLRSLPRM